MATFQDGSGTVVLSGVRDGTADDTAATRGYVNGITPGSLTIHNWPGSFQSNFDVAVGSHWSRTVAGQLVVWTFVGHSDTTITSSNFSDYIPQANESYWTEFGAEGAANEYPDTFVELFYARTGTIWMGSDAHLYLATDDHVIHDTSTRNSNDPATTTTGWKRQDNNLPAAPASNSTSTQNYELQVSATGNTTSWVAATGGGGGGLNAVISDNTLRGNGASQSTALSVSRLQTWNTETAYVLGDMVVDNFDYQIYKADVANIPALQIVTLPTVQRVSFGTATGFTELRYLVEFVGTNPTLDPAQTYDFSIGNPGAAINVNFTILGSDISTTDLTGFWVISPTAPSYSVISGATPTVRTSQPLTNISISLGTAVANPRPGLDRARWVEVSNTDVDFEARYSPARGEALRWNEGTTEFVGAVEDIFFEDVLAANSTVVRGSDNVVRYTITGVLPAIVTALVAADRIVFTSARLPIRTFGTVTAGATPDSAVLVGTCIQGDGAEDSDAATVGDGILARGPQTFRGSFAAVSIIPESNSPVNLIEDFHSVADTTARMALTTSDVKFGDVVFQQDDQTEWQVTHAQTAVANFVNFSWSVSTTGTGARELAVHFSDLASMPTQASIYTLRSGADSWSFLGSRVTTRTASNNTIEWRIPDASIGGSANRDGLLRTGVFTTSSNALDFTQVGVNLNSVDDIRNQWPGSFTEDFTVTQGEFWVRDARVFTCISTRNINSGNHALFGPGANSVVWSELTNEHVIRTWPASYNNSEQFILRRGEIYQVDTDQVYISIIVDSLGNGIASNAVAIDSSTDFDTFNPTGSNSATFWRRFDGAGGSGGGTSNAAIINTSGVASLAAGITGEEIRDLIGALDPTDFTLHRNDEDLILTIDGSTTFTVDLNDVRQGPTLPARAHNNEVFWLNAPSGGRHAGLYRYDATISFWFPADAAFNDVVADTLTVDTRLQVPSHGNDLSVVDPNDAASIGDLLQEGRDIRNSLGPDVTVHGDLEEQPDTAAVYVQSIELDGSFSNETVGTFRHARQVPVQNNYPTLPTANANRTALVLAGFPDAPLRGRVGLHGTSRIDQYMPTANNGRIGGTIPLERALNGGDDYQPNEDFVAAGGFVDGVNDPVIRNPNAKFLLGQDNAQLINHDPATGNFTTPTDGILIGMTFEPHQLLLDHTGLYPLWTMDFQSRSITDSRNVGIFMEETPGTTGTPVGDALDALWNQGPGGNQPAGSFLDIRFGGQITPSNSQQVEYTLTLRDSTTYTFPAVMYDSNGDLVGEITTRTFNGNFFWRIPRALITSSTGTLPTQGRLTGIALNRGDPGEYHMRLKLGTNNDSLLRDDIGTLLFTENSQYSIISHLHVDSNNRLAVNAFIYEWNLGTSQWQVIGDNLRTSTGVTGFNVTVLSDSEAIDVINPTIRIGLAEYQNNSSLFINNLTMSKIFIAKAEAAFTANNALAIVNDATPFKGLAISNSTDGFEFTRLNHVDIPYSAYDPVAGTILPTANWLLPDTSTTDPVGFRTALGSTNWVPVSEAMSTDGSITRICYAA